MPRKRSTRLAAAAIALLLVAGVAACSDDSDSSSSTSTTASTNTTTARDVGTGPGTPAPEPLAQPATITVVHSTFQEFLSGLYIAQAMGEFEKENLTVNIETAPPADGLLLVAQGVAQIQFGGFGVGLFNMNASEDSPVKGIANVHLSEPPRQGWYVRKEFVNDAAAARGTATIDDLDLDALEGAPVGCGTSGQGWADGVCFPLWRWMQENDIDTSFFQSPTPITSMTDSLTSLETGSLAIGLAVTPLWLELQGPDSCCVLIEGTNGVAASQIMANAEWLENDRDQAQAFARAMIRTHRTYMQGDYHADTEIATILAEIYQRDLAEYQQTPSLVFDPNLGFDPEIGLGFQAMFGENGALTYTEPLTLDQIADVNLVREVLGQ